MFFQNALGIFNYTYTGGATRAFVYDGNGNLLDDGERTYQWDAKNRLIEAKRGADTWQWSYNAFDQRVSEKKNGVVTKRWVWAGGNQPAEERDAAGNVTRRFYPQGEQAGAVKYFYTKDHLGSIREVMGANGTVVSSSRYDAWGVRSTVGTQDAASFGFTGHMEHKELGLVFTLYRAYDPATGRWLSRDPIGESGGINLYGYVANNPVNLIDPLGLSDSWPWSNWDYNPAQAYIHAFYDIGAGISEAGIAALEALEAAEKARLKRQDELDAICPESDSVPTTAGGAVNEAMPAVANAAAKAATGIPGTSFTGPASAPTTTADFIGTAAQGAVIGLGTR
jgi:RHS repeat-associated protein